MSHLTYEEKFGRDWHRGAAPSPDFCGVCFRKMFLYDGVLKTNLLISVRSDNSTEKKDTIIYEPNGRGGADRVLVRPHVRHGTACGWGNTSSSLGANLWHATTGVDRNSICQQDDTIDEAVETMFIRPGSSEWRESGDGMSDAQLKGVVANPSMMRARVFDEDENYQGWQEERMAQEEQQVELVANPDVYQPLNSDYYKTVGQHL